MFTAPGGGFSLSAHGLEGASDKREVEDLTKEFIAESQEGLDRMEQCLTTLEVRPNDPELVAEIFRAVHTIKGTTGFLGFGRLETLAHVGETLLGKLRDGKLRVSGELISGLLELLDGLRGILALIDETGGEGVRRGDEDGGLIARLRELAAGDQEPVDDVAEAAALVEAVAHVKDEGGVSYSGAEGSGGNERTLRVDVEVLNRMMNLVGELVLTRNQILQTSPDAQGFAQLGRRLNNVTTELRETVMQARMQPVGNVFGKFPRLVRDLAKTCGKRVRIEFAGQDTGLDKSLLEAIKDPLTHAVRNAVDHGVEGPEVRLAAGKHAEGVLRLRAFHQGGSVVIELCGRRGGHSGGAGAGEGDRAEAGDSGAGAGDVGWGGGADGVSAGVFYGGGGDECLRARRWDGCGAGECGEGGGERRAGNPVREGNYAAVAGSANAGHYSGAGGGERGAEFCAAAECAGGVGVRGAG